MSAISPPPVGADAEDNVQTDNRKALATLRKEKQQGSLAAVIGTALALGLVGAVIATLGARRSRPWYARFASMF